MINVIKVRTSIILSQCRQLVKDGTICKDDFDAENSSMKRPIAEETETSSIGRDISTDLAASQG